MYIGFMETNEILVDHWLQKDINFQSSAIIYVKQQGQLDEHFVI